MEYTEKVLDHFMNPRNVGDMEDASGIGNVGNAKCGDIMRFYLKIEGDVISAATFKTFGCGAAVATSSMATEIIKGKTIDQALAITNKDVMDALGGLPSAKAHCSILAEEGLRVALWDYSQKSGIVIEGLQEPSRDHGHG